MPKENITDLDLLVGKPIKVRLGGEVYKLPADIPAPLFLRITSFADSDDSDAEIASTMYEELLALFQVHQPDLKRLTIGLAQLTAVIPQVYGGEGEEPDRPTKPKRKPSTRSSSRRRKRASSR